MVENELKNNVITSNVDNQHLMDTAKGRNLII